VKSTIKSIGMFIAVVVLLYIATSSFAHSSNTKLAKTQLECQQLQANLNSGGGAVATYDSYIRVANATEYLLTTYLGMSDSDPAFACDAWGNRLRVQSSANSSLSVVYSAGPDNKYDYGLQDDVGATRAGVRYYASSYKNAILWWAGMFIVTCAVMIHYKLRHFLKWLMLINIVLYILLSLLLIISSGQYMEKYMYHSLVIVNAGLVALVLAWVSGRPELCIKRLSACDVCGYCVSATNNKICPECGNRVRSNVHRLFQ